MIEIHKLYEDKLTLTFDPDKHIYQVGDEIIPGVTGIVGVINKPALIWWALNEARDYLLKNWKPGEKYDEIQIGEHIAEARMAHRKYAKTTADKGTLVHQWIEEWIKHRNPKDLVNKEAKQATEAFMEWINKHKVEFHLSERRIYSKNTNMQGLVILPLLWTDTW